LSTAAAEIRHHNHAAEAADLRRESEGRFGKRISRIWLRRTSIAALPARNLNTILPMKITRRSRYLDRCLPELLTRWEQEHVLEAAQRLDKTPDTMRTRREAVQHPFSDMKMRMGVTHLLTKTLPKVTPEIAPCARPHLQAIGHRLRD
jgi:hypothetical protein